MAESAKEERAELVSVWRQRIRRSQEMRDEEKSIWDKNLLSLRGKLKPPSSVWNEEDPWISVELVHASIRAAIPSLLYSNPKWSVQPKKPEFQPDPTNPGSVVDVSWEKARSKELWLDHTWKESEGNTHVRVAIESAFLAYGAVKVGYAPDFADDQKRGEIEYDDEGNPVIESIDEETGKFIPKLVKGEFLYDEKGEMIFDDETGMAVTHPGTLQRERFFVEWVNWENLLFDVEGGNCFKNHRYVIEEWIRPLDHVKNDPRYPASKRKKVKASTSLKETKEKASIKATGTSDPVMVQQDEVYEDEARVRGWDIYCFETGRYHVLVESDDDEGADDFLLDEDIPPGYEHGPFVFLKWNEDPGRWYPRTDAEAMAKLELEYNLTRSQMAMHRNQSRTRYFEVKGAGFDDQDGGEIEKIKFTSGPSGTVVRVKSPDGVVPARKDAMDGTYFTTIPDIKSDFREMAGQAGEQQGVASSDTATQASLIAASADVRNSDRRDNLVQKFLCEIGTKLLQVAQANSTQVEWIAVRRRPEEQSPFDFIQVNPEELDGEFDVEIAVGSTQAKNTQQRVALYERIVTMLAQNPQIAASPTLVKRLFAAMDIHDEQLVHEVTAIGQIALQAMGLPPTVAGVDGQGQMGAAPSAGAVGQALGNIQNQNVSAPNAQAGVATGVRNR